VNIVALGSGARFGFRASQRHVAGATLGFVLLLVLMGLGLHELLQWWPAMTQVVQWAGVAFLLYMAFKLAADNGQLQAKDSGRAPSMLYGAVMQWLNPKAWLACVAGMGAFVADGEARMGAFVADGEARLVWQFAAVYLVVCYLSVGCWVYAGTFLRGYLHNPAGMRLFNRGMALLLAVSAIYLVVP
jgi:threonine/homoserine/homoserine lactone efflux protein